MLRVLEGIVIWHFHALGSAWWLERDWGTSRVVHSAVTAGRAALLFCGGGAGGEALPEAPTSDETRPTLHIDTWRFGAALQRTRGEDTHGADGGRRGKTSETSGRCFICAPHLRSVRGNTWVCLTLRGARQARGYMWQLFCGREVVLCGLCSVKGRGSERRRRYRAFEAKGMAAASIVLYRATRRRQARPRAPRHIALFHQRVGGK